MATKVTMEALSPTMEEGRLVKWNKNEGDPVATGDVLAEVETDKAVMELVARGDGVLRKRLANEGDASPVGTLLAVIASPDENIDSILTAYHHNLRCWLLCFYLFKNINSIHSIFARFIEVVIKEYYLRIERKIF